MQKFHPRIRFARSLGVHRKKLIVRPLAHRGETTAANVQVGYPPGEISGDGADSRHGIDHARLSGIHGAAGLVQPSRS